MILKLSLTLFSLLACLVAEAQKPDIRLRFLSDSLHIARPCTLRLKISHVPELTITPNSSPENFFPFELIQEIPGTRKESPTLIQSTTTYVLQSFDISPFQQVNLPLTLVRHGDTSYLDIYSNPIPFASRLPASPESLAFQPHQGLTETATPVRWERILLLLAGLIIMALGVWRILRPYWHRFLRTQQIRKEWQATRQSMYAIKNIAWQPETFMSELNNCWKMFLAPMYPGTLKSLTTTEMVPLLQSWELLTPQNSQLLLRCARTGDQVIHGGGKLSKSQALFLWEDVYEVLIEVHRLRKMEISSAGSHQQQNLSVTHQK